MTPSAWWLKSIDVNTRFRGSLPDPLLALPVCPRLKVCFWHKSWLGLSAFDQKTGIMYTSSGALKKSIPVVLAAMALFGCGKPLTKTQKGAAIGTAGGAAAGAIVGKVAGNTALGAIIGAAVGGSAGAIIGHKMDEQAKEIQQKVPNAEVHREGEGIIVTFNSNVLFGFDKSDLSDAAKSTVRDLNTILQQYPDENVLVIGNTDNVGSKSY